MIDIPFAFQCCACDGEKIPAPWAAIMQIRTGFMRSLHSATPHAEANRKAFRHRINV
jgi:hypothetical protein